MVPTGRRSAAAVLAAALAGVAMLLAVEGFHSGTAAAVAFEYGPGSTATHALVREQANRAPLVLRAGKVDVVSAAVTVAEPATLTVRAQDAAGRSLTLLPKSRVGSLVARRNATVLRHVVRAGNTAVQLRLPAARVRGKRIAVVAVATAGTRTSTVRIPLAG